jgi:exopolysaccharide biosynthesis predicted pyruvyltransferase EpsI
MLYSKKKRGFRHLDKIYKSEKGNLNFYLIGTSDRSNIGDHIIAKSEMLNLSNWLPGINGFEITGDHYRSDKKRIASYITNKDLIFISGGGFLGDLWMDEENMVRDIIQRFPDNLIIILPQTIFFNDKYSLFNEYNRTAKIYNSHHNLYVFARDEDSYNLLKTFLPECRTGLFPDMALLFPEPIPKREINMKLVLTCFRTDKEQILDEETISLIEKGLEKEGYVIRKTSTLHSGKNNGDISLKQRDKIIQEKINEFSEASLIITDRLHGMIMSFLAGTPCIAFDNLSHKVSGVYNKWLSKCNYLFVVNDLEEYQHSLEKIKALNLEHYKHPSFEEEKKAIKGKILGLIAGENINE